MKESESAWDISWELLYHVK